MLDKDARGRPQTAATGARGASRRLQPRQAEARRENPSDPAALDGQNRRLRARRSRSRWRCCRCCESSGSGPTRHARPVHSTAGSIWISTDAIYDMTSAIDRAVSPDDRLGRQRRAHPLQHEAASRPQRAVAQSAARTHTAVCRCLTPAPRTVVDRGPSRCSSRDPATMPGLYRTTLSGAEPTRVADGPDQSSDRRRVTAES